MTQHRDRERRQRQGHAYHARRRFFKKVSLLSLVVGILSLICSVIIFALSFLRVFTANHHRMAAFSLGYLVVGVLLIVLRLILERFRGTGTSQHRPQPYLNTKFGEATPATVEADPATSSDESGAVLILVLIMLGLVAGLVLQAQTAARAALRQRQASVLTAQLQHAATDAAHAALQRLADDEDLVVDHTNEAWAITREVKDPSGITTRVRILDESRCFDVNNLAVTATGNSTRTADDIVMDIMTLCGDFSPVERVEALKDWIDGDDDGTGESAYYKTLTPPYRPANRILYSWGEWAQVRGFSRAFFERHPRHSALEVFNADVVDCLTVVPLPRARPLPVNVNTASKEVLLGVLGLDREDLVAAILFQRALGPIRSVETSAISADPQFLRTAGRYLDVKSSAFVVDVQAYAEGRTEHLRVLARRDTQGDVDAIQWVF